MLDTSSPDVRDSGFPYRLSCGRMSNTDYVDHLQSFYDENALLVSAFDCEHSDACKAAANCLLSQGAEAHVGTRYGEDLRVVVVSLDTGGGNESLEERCRGIEGLHPNGATNAHMKGTTHLLGAIYGTENGNLYELYAMTNAAKCSRAGPGSGKVGHVLYKNCSQFVVPELACLDPDMIVTQSNEAWWALRTADHLSGAQETDIEDRIAHQAVGKIVREWLWSLARKGVGRTLGIFPLPDSALSVGERQGARQQEVRHRPPDRSLSG